MGQYQGIGIVALIRFRHGTRSVGRNRQVVVAPDRRPGGNHRNRITGGNDGVHGLVEGGSGQIEGYRKGVHHRPCTDIFDSGRDGHRLSGGDVGCRIEGYPSDGDVRLGSLGGKGPYGPRRGLGIFAGVVMVTAFVLLGVKIPEWLPIVFGNAGLEELFSILLLLSPEDVMKDAGNGGAA